MLVLGLVFRIVEPLGEPRVQIVKTRFGGSEHHAVVTRFAQDFGQGTHARIRVVRKEGHLRVRPHSGKDAQEAFDGGVAHAVRIREIETALRELADVRELFACRGDADVAGPAAERFYHEEDDVGFAVAPCLELLNIVLTVLFAFACRGRAILEGVIGKGEAAEQRDAFGVIAAPLAFRELVLDFVYQTESDRRNALPAHVARRKPVLRREAGNRKGKCNAEDNPVGLALQGVDAIRCRRAVWDCRVFRDRRAAPLGKHLPVKENRPDNTRERNERRQQKVPRPAQEHAPH